MDHYFKSAYIDGKENIKRQQAIQKCTKEKLSSNRVFKLPCTAKKCIKIPLHSCEYSIQVNVIQTYRFIARSTFGLVYHLTLEIMIVNTKLTTNDVKVWGHCYNVLNDE